MRWSSLNSLFIFLLASAALDAIVALPLPDSDEALYRRTPPPPAPPHHPAPHANAPAVPAVPHTPIARRLRSAGPVPQSPSKIPVSVKKPHNPAPAPATGGASSSTHSYNLRAPKPRPQNVQTTVVQGKKKAAPPTKIPRPKAQGTTGDLKSYNYRAKAIAQGLVYSPGQGKVVHRTPSPDTLKGLHADHVVEAQAVKAAHPNLNPQQHDEVSKILNDPMKNLVLTKDTTNIHKGTQVGHVIRGEPTDATPGTKRYMDAVAGQTKAVTEEIDRVAGSSRLTDLQKKIAKETGTKSPS